VRYLQKSGAEVEIGQPYVEVEAMKMIMPIKATETGKITHSLSSGSVISAGDMLASLELKDPSKVKKIAPSQLEVAASEAVKHILAGFSGNAEAALQKAFDEIDDMESAAALVTGTISEFLRVESLFTGKLKYDVVRDLTNQC
jgi:acetyl-CoA carboxylase/biotin carboxylase 1